jgi:hypothetical protein
MHQLNKDDITSAVLFPPANRKEDREPGRPIASAAAAVETNSNNPGSVYDFSATKAETPPVPLQKSRREAAAKSPRQAAAGRCNDEMPMAAAFSEGPSSSNSSSNKVGKQLVSTTKQLLPSQQLETKTLPPPSQHQQQQVQPLRHQQHHNVVAASGTGLAGGSSSSGANAGSIYQNNPQLGYADSR